MATLLHANTNGKVLANPGDPLTNRMGQQGRLMDVRLYSAVVEVEVDGATLLGNIDDWGLELVR